MVSPWPINDNAADTDTNATEKYDVNVNSYHGPEDQGVDRYLIPSQS